MSILPFLMIVCSMESPQKKGQIQVFAALGTRTMHSELTV